MRKWIVIGIVVVLLIIVYSSIKGTYNNMVTLQEGVSSRWSQVENVYQRRLDLIPNLVSTVKMYAAYEQKTLTDVVNARARATSINVNPEKLDANSLKNFQAAQDNVGSAIGRLMVVMEKYPDLKANQNFLDLQAQLEGTENRIANERMKFNESAQEYNTYIRSFPKNIYAKLFDFEKKAYFEADKGANKAPKVE